MIDRSRARPDHTDPDRGAVTVETAVIMPALVLLLAVLLACLLYTSDAADDAPRV